jgi:thiamine-monophosphate kinase
MVQTLADIGEFEFIRRIRKLLGRAGIQSGGLTLGVGDDCASFQPEAGVQILVTCDCMVEGRHYLKDYMTPVDIGRRAMVMNISDIGAMGGYPLYALVSLGLTEDTPIKDIEDIYQGFIEELRPFQASLIGGNVTKSQDFNFIDITLIGKAEKDTILRRSTARIGDAVLVTGYPGQAAAGLRLLLDWDKDRYPESHPLISAYTRPAHKAREGHAIARSGLASSMIDISDGLIGDLGHICEESGVGAEVVREKLPVSEHMSGIDLESGDLYDMVLNDSDDYELIVTCPPENVEMIRSIVTEINNVRVSEIGSITDASEGLKIVLPDGSRCNLTSHGWDHFKR